MAQFLFKSVQDDKKPTNKVGQLLQYEREKQHLSAAEIAQDLRLSVEVIRKLESGNFKELPQPVYIRGYIRAYCKLLNIDPQPLLEELELPSEEQGENDLLATVDEDVYRLTRLWGSLAVLCAIVLLVSLWWFERAREFRPVFPALDAELSPHQVSRQPATLALPVDTSNPGEFASGNDSDANPGMDVDVGSVQTKPLPADTSNPGELASGDDSDANPGMDVDVGSVQMDGGAPSAETEAVTGAASLTTAHPAENPAATNPAVTKLMIKVVDRRSWVNITDGKGKVLVYGTLSPGYQTTVDGVFPLSFRLGDARGMRIWIDGDEYDLQRHISRLNTAFFRLDEPPQP